MNEGKYCPLLSITGEDLNPCVGESCAWYIPDLTGPTGRVIRAGHCAICDLEALPEIFRGGERSVSYFRSCPSCGANLDPGEVCDCTKKTAQSAANTLGGMENTATDKATCSAPIVPGSERECKPASRNSAKENQRGIQKDYPTKKQLIQAILRMLELLDMDRLGNVYHFVLHFNK